MYPNHEKKSGYSSLINPDRFIEYQKSQGKVPPDFKAPTGVIFCYQKSLLATILNQEETTPAHYLHRDLYLLNSAGQQIGISSGFGIGAPAATVALEQLIATGSRYFLSIGSAGSLSPDLDPGDLVVCDRAIRDEGVSHHYLETGKYSYPSRLLTSKLKGTMTELGFSFTEGTSWSIDTPFRETAEEVRNYQNEGVLTVEMEAAALFAVTKYRGLDIASAFVISDSLAGIAWNPQFESNKTQAGLESLYRAATRTLSDIIQHPPSSV